MARRSSMPRRTSPGKDKIVPILKQGETSRIIIANKVGCDPNCARLVKDEFLRSQRG